MITVGLMLGLASCGPSLSEEAKEHISQNQVIMLGHGGMGNRTFVPMDSEHSLREALRTSLSGTECDVRMSSDSVLVVFHDASMNPATHCEGRVEERPWGELSHCLYRSLFYNEKVISLLDLLALPEAQGRTFSLDVKLPDGADPTFRKRMALTLHTTMAKNSSDKKFLIESQDQTLLHELHRLGTLATLLYYTSNPRENALALKEWGIDGVSIDYRLVNRDDVDTWQQHGMFVMLWGANTRSGNKKALNLLPNGVQSDRPEHLARLRAE